MSLALAGWMDQWALYALPLTGSTLVAYGLFQLVTDLRRPQEKKVAQRLRENGGASRTSRNEQAVRESLLRRQRAAESAIARGLGRLSFVPTLQRALDQGNLPWVATSVVVNLVGAAALVYLATWLLYERISLALALAGATMLLPLLYVHIRRKMRINKLVQQLPDVFELLGQGLRAGHSLGNAIHLVSQQMSDPAGIEFARVFHEQNLGLKIDDALLNMARRIDQMDVRFFVTAVLIQRTTGGDLAEVLDNIGDVIRERIKLFGTVKALTAEGRLSGYVLFALPFAVFAMEQVINPEYGNILLEHPIGQYMLITAFVMQLLGLAMIKKIVNIKV